MLRVLNQKLNYTSILVVILALEKQVLSVGSDFEFFLSRLKNC